MQIIQMHWDGMLTPSSDRMEREKEKERLVRGGGRKYGKEKKGRERWIKRGEGGRDREKLGEGWRE